ncbi:MAG TPA: PVC-type heme-binding CxxCH protein [Candidatus Acidoferrum sp.]|nr:PVC-type heme-binding CxxCH protein [Candidatus Acidoferrum sp.]
MTTKFTSCAVAVTALTFGAFAADDAKPAAKPASGTNVSAISTNAPKPAHNRGFGRQVAFEEMKQMAVADGLEVTLFASEPMLVNPCDMDVDARGRVWITEGANYRKWANPPTRQGGDRIVILEDKNKDGVADKSTVFYQGEDVNSALGICVLGNKVIVSCSPNVFVFTDENDDGVADKKELLFTGIKGVQHDHGVHAFVFGPDGKLYFNFGNSGDRIHDKNGKTIVDVDGNEVVGRGKPYRQGMVFRCNLDGSEFEVLGHNFRNNYEVAVDSFGTLWQSDNDDDGNKGVRISYVMERGNFGYQEELKGSSWGQNWKRGQEKGAPESDKVFYEWHQHDPGVVPNLLNTGAGSPTGITIYEGKLLPKVFRNQMIHCDAGPSVVRAYPVTADGAGYAATITNVLWSSDKWFRPSDVCVAPDGSLMIADWNDPGVGGHAAGDHDLSMMRGRVFRVAPKGKKYTVPKLDLKSAKGAVAALASSHHETRYLAYNALSKMGKNAEKALTSLAKDKDEPRLRARALQLVARMPGNEQKTVDAMVADNDSDIRIVGLRTARKLNLDAVPLVAKLANDPSAQVRRECAIALRHQTSPEAAKLWAQLATQYDGKDRWYLEALGIGADKNEDAFFGAWLGQVGDKWNTPAGRDIIWRSRSAKAVPMLTKLITAKDANAKDKDRYMRALDFITGVEKEQALVEIATGGLDVR